MHERLNGRTTTHATVLAGARLRRCAIVVGRKPWRPGTLRRRGGVLRRTSVPLLMRGYGGAGSFVTRAIANALHAPDSDAHEPQQRARPRENAEQGTDFRLSRNFQFQSIVSWKAVRAIWGVHPNRPNRRKHLAEDQMSKQTRNKLWITPFIQRYFALVYRILAASGNVHSHFYRESRCSPRRQTSRRCPPF